MANMSLSGNPRYQPKDLIPHFGYDNLARTLVEVELAAIRTLGDARVIRQADIDLLTPDIEKKLLSITMSEVDIIEREITKHDIRALVQIMQGIMPAPLRRWVHVPLTSYDVLDTARSLQFVRAHGEVVRPKAHAVIACFCEQAMRHADEVQIGRTHGQHALPITVGFWFATVLSRVLFNTQQADHYAKSLVGKISGAVGAYNAQSGLGIIGRSGVAFEDRVLERLGLTPAPISTQILPPEPLAFYLFSCLMLSGSLGQFGSDGRNLMRSEIEELAEPFEKDQVGSSTMAHKRNPVSFEGLEGGWKKNKSEFGKVLDTTISEHQRDLVGSSLARDFPTLIVNLVNQLDTLLRPGKEDKRPLLSRAVIDTKACGRNLQKQGDKILAEPFYLALQMYGYEGDAHKVVNHQAMPRVGVNAASLYDAIEQVSHLDPALLAAWENIPKELHKFFRDPSNYTGLAREKVWQTCERAQNYLKLTWE